MNNPIADKIRHNRASLSFLRFIEPRIIPIIHETGGISNGNIVTAYQNGSVMESRLKLAIINNPQKEVAINVGK